MIDEYATENNFDTTPFEEIKESIMNLDAEIVIF